VGGRAAYCQHPELYFGMPHLENNYEERANVKFAFISVEESGKEPRVKHRVFIQKNANLFLKFRYQMRSVRFGPSKISLCCQYLIPALDLILALFLRGGGGIQRFLKF
jgi:hypothetical protein